MRVAWFLFLLLSVAFAAVAMGVAVNQILDDKDLSVTWAGWAFGFSLLGLLLTTALTTATDPQGHSERRRMSRHRYRRRVHASVEQMETLGLVTQAEYVLRTRQVYVDVALQPQTVTGTADGADFTSFRPDTARAEGDRAPLASFLAGRRRVLSVLGAAGSGKTTLARYTALDLAERRWRPWRAQFWRRRLPVLLYLRDHAEEILTGPGEDEIDLAEAAVAAPWLKKAVDAPWLRRHLDRGRCVVLLDGLDEVADGADRKRVVGWVDDQIDRYPGNVFVVTSRPHGYADNRLRSADVLQVQRFTRDQIHAFLHTWYRAIERRARRGNRAEIDRVASAAAEDLFDRVNALPALYDLAANPLLLTMIANVHRYRGALPAGRAALYAEMCQVLLHRRQEVKGVADPVEDALGGAQKERVVRELAWHMMRHKLRDIPASDAARAIRPVLLRATSTLSPEAFLDYVRRSGLLTDRRYGHYGFAHLTLQEHLAATSAQAPEHRARRQYLAESVNDPWWRETTLLWAAGTDASPVVRACLDEPTATSLSLAYDCAEHALDLDPDLRDRLDRLLANAPTGPEQARFLDGVAATRTLHDTDLLDTGSRLCRQPLTRDMWNRYAAQANPADPHVPPPGDTPATGLWPADVYGFLTWLNSLFTDGTSYRLPTSGEAAQALHLHPSADSLWTHDDDRTSLSVSGPHPHRPTPQQISAYPDLILDHTHLLFRILFPRSRLTFTRFLAYNRPRELTRPHHRLLHAIDLISALRTLGNNAGSHARDPALALAHGLGRDLAFDQPPSLDRALALARDLARDLDLDLSLNLDPHPSRFRAHARNLDLDRDLDHDLVLVLDHGCDLDLDHDLDQDRDLDLILGTDLDRALARDLDLDLARALDSVHALSFAEARTLDRDPAVGLARDLAFARGLASRDLERWQDASAAVNMGRVCLTLASASRTPQAWNRLSQSGPAPRRERSGLSSLLSFAVREFSGRSVTDDPQTALRKAAHLAAERGALRSAETIENARTLAAPLWDRSRPARQSDAVLAATTLLSLLIEDGTESLGPELPDLLCGALTTLIALTPDTRPHDTAAQNGLVFLVRE